MTMPNERMRSLRWGFELLAEMQQDESLDQAVRDRAASVAMDYPRPTDLLALIEVNSVEQSGVPEPVPERFGLSIDRALDLFEAVRGCRNGASPGSDKTQHSLMYVLRHFPGRGSWRYVDFGDWLWPEDIFR